MFSPLLANRITKTKKKKSRQKIFLDKKNFLQDASF